MDVSIHPLTHPLTGRQMLCIMVTYKTSNNALSGSSDAPPVRLRWAGVLLLHGPILVVVWFERFRREMKGLRES
jgi:hypothetical protein